MKTVVLTIALFAVSAFASDEREVLVGLPSVQYRVEVDDCDRTRMNDEDSVKNAVRIVKIGDEYIWTTREGRQLIHVVTGITHYFIDPSGGGYVKVMPKPSGGYSFLEHVGLGMATFTYFGSSDEFSP